MGKRGPKPRGFWTQVGFGDGCWEWSGTRFANGYGRAQDGQRSVGAHQMAWERTHLRPVPDGLVVMHVCDNKPCVRPSHLRIGTPADNLRDMVAKGRSLRGSANPQRKLDDARVREIRARSDDGEPRAALAREFGVSEALIFAIAKRQAWSWLP